jgi:hypothetical protein
MKKYLKYLHGKAKNTKIVKIILKIKKKVCEINIPITRLTV